MCGIAGIGVAPGRQLPRLREALEAMSAAMVHRGPDDAGLWVSPECRAGLAARRLAVRDLSPAGHQPMGRDDAAVWISYNGEIYNADELRAALEQAGLRFRSTSDTEVILHGYTAWGPGVVDRLRGMFAFAVCDLRAPASPRLFLARDRLGIKPLYVAHTSDGLLFASELKALLASGLVAATPDPSAVLAYLMTGSIPGPRTVYADIQALEPGGLLEWHDGAAAGRRWWSPPPPADGVVSQGEAVERVRALLADAVESHLVSDVPLGAFLSGGLDSSTVAALMRGATTGPIRTCSIVFEEAEHSEARFASAVAEAIGSEHHERLVTGADVAGEIDRIVGALDQPTVDAVNTYFVSETARQAGLTVALSGVGGDEIFGGYPNTFREAPLLARALQVTHAIPGGRWAASAALALARHRRWEPIRDAVNRPPSLASAYVARRAVFAPREARALVRPDVRDAAHFDPVAAVEARTGRSRDGFGWISRAEIGSFLQPQLLRDTDAMSMAHSLEVRVPLLDHVLVEAVLRLPDAVKRAGAGPKPLMKAAIGDLLPREVRARTAKQGFTLPFDRWLRTTLRPLMEETLLSPRSAILQYCERAALEQVWQAYLDGRVHWSRPWCAAVLGLWAERGR